MRLIKKLCNKFSVISYLWHYCINGFAVKMPTIAIINSGRIKKFALIMLMDQAINNKKVNTNNNNLKIPI